MSTATETTQRVIVNEKEELAFRYSVFCDGTVRGVSGDGMADWFDGNARTYPLGPNEWSQSGIRNLTDLERAWMWAEWDLITCVPAVGDLVEFRERRLASAEVDQGERLRVNRISGGYIYTDLAEESVLRSYWIFSIDSHGYRTIPSLTVPEMPEWIDHGHHSLIINQCDEAVAGFQRDCTCKWCSIVRGGVDEASRVLSEMLGVSIESSERKEWVGRMLRWMRARVVQNARDRQAPEPEVQAPEPEPMPERNLDREAPVTQSDLSELRARITVLEDQNRALTERVRAADQLANAMRADWTYLNEELNRQAINRDWCSEYEDLQNKVNRHTSVLQLESRRKTVSGTVNGTVTFTFSYSIEDLEIGTDEDSEDAIREHFDENTSARELIDYHIDRYSGEIEVVEIEVD